jgi:hypothetical protein
MAWPVPSAISNPSVTRVTFGNEYVNVHVPSLAGGETYTTNVEFTCPSIGAFYIRSVADEYQRGEWGAAWEQDDSVLVNCIEQDDARPDLVADTYLQGTHVEGGQLYYDIDVYTRNEGLSNASASITRVYQDGIAIQDIAVPELAPYYWNNETRVSIACMPSNITIDARADDDNTVDESVEGNNNQTVVFPPCPDGFPDLTVELSINGNFTNATGTYYNVTMTTSNIGNATASQQVETNVYYGNVGIVTWIGIWQLQPGESSSSYFVLPQLGLSENRSLDAYADPLNRIAEINEGNNHAHMVVPTVPSPDLAVTSVQVAHVTWIAGRLYNVTVFASNIGELNSVQTDISGRVMADGITYSGFQSTIPGLLPGRSANRSGMLTCPAQGDYQLVGLVDSWGNNQESNEENNIMVVNIHCIDIVVRINNTTPVISKHPKDIVAIGIEDEREIDIHEVENPNIGIGNGNAQQENAEMTDPNGGVIEIGNGNQANDGEMAIGNGQIEIGGNGIGSQIVDEQSGGIANEIAANEQIGGEIIQIDSDALTVNATVNETEKEKNEYLHWKDMSQKDLRTEFDSWEKKLSAEQNSYGQKAKLAVGRFASYMYFQNHVGYRELAMLMGYSTDAVQVLSREFEFAVANGQILKEDLPSKYFNGDFHEYCRLRLSTSESN